MIPAILEHNASSVTPISLRIRGVQNAFSGAISGQRIHSALAFAFSQPCDGMQVSTPPMEPGLAWRPVLAELEGKTLAMVLAHGRQASYFRTAEAEFWVDAGGNTAELTRCAGDPSVWLFGPMLILALARRAIFCLHSSAVQHSAGALILVGASGAGKSTLAGARATERLCDDISPMTLQHGALITLPQFPQLKLARPDVVPDLVPVAGLIYLQPAIPAQAERLAPMSAAEVHRRLLAHTVASRLFTAQDTQRWWQAIAQWCPHLVGRSFMLRPRHDAHTPDRAMLNALDSVAALL